jgi:hypothetical protein
MLYQEKSGNIVFEHVIRIGISNLMYFLIFVGVFEGLLYSIVSLIFDDEIPTFKMCTHLSFEDQQILKEIRVRNIKEIEDINVG